MKNNNYGKMTNKSFIILLCLTIFICASFLYLGNLEKQKAYADYEDVLANQDAILTFNQLYDPSQTRASYSNITYSENNGLITMSGTNSNTYSNSANPISEQQFNCVVGHKYYFRYYFTDTTSIPWTLGLRNPDSTIVYEFTRSSVQIVYDTIFEPDSDMSVQVLGGTYKQTNYQCSFYVQFTDLSVMFGIGSEPNLEQAQSIFVSPFYAYNTGSPLSASTIEAYNQGVVDTLGSTTYDVVLDDFYNNSFAFTSNNTNFNSQLFKTDPYTINGQTIFGLNAANYSWRNEGASYNNNSGLLTVIGLNINNVIPIGSNLSVKFQGRASKDDYNSTSPTSVWTNLYLATFNGTNFVKFLDLGSGIMTVRDYREFTVSAPANAESLYLIANGSINCSYLSINVEYTNSTLLINSIYESGQESIKKQYNVGGDLYNEIFNAGVRSTQDDAAVFQDTWSFVGSAFSGLGSMLAVELFPNVPIGVFVAFPLLLGLIFFIVKLTKGGS